MTKRLKLGIMLILVLIALIDAIRHNGPAKPIPAPRETVPTLHDRAPAYVPVLPTPKITFPLTAKELR